MATTVITRPHDLLRLVIDVRELPAEAPSWVHEALQRASWVVVRRAPTTRGQIPVGVRGQTRAERYAMTVPSAVVAHIVTPEELSGSAVHTDRDMPALRALRAVRPILNRTGMAWGPTGSVGFELATKMPTATATSDLDLVVRVTGIDNAVLQRLSNLCARLGDSPAEVDCQVDTPLGAISLTEIVSASPYLMAKRSSGPVLVSAAQLRT
jgi:phosphoribosyl-dephospho-CoA transferase